MAFPQTSESIEPVIEAYHRGEALTLRQVGILRRYLREWINSSAWERVKRVHDGPTLAELRAGVNLVVSVPSLRSWLDRLKARGIYGPI